MIAVVVQILPPLSLLALLTVPPAVRACIGALREARDRTKLTPVLGMNFLINLLTPLLLAVGLFLSR